MNQITTLLVLAVLSSQTHSAPQFISFKDGKLGVNFGGYHAGVGIGGLLGGGSGAGGLYAEAGTPTGQAARAGLGGVVSENGGTSGGLYAGATAGGNVKAHAGLGGGVTAEKSAGGGFASAQAGPHYAASGLGGESSVEGVSEFSLSKSKDVIKPVHKTFYTEYNVDATNEVKPLPKVDILKEVHVQESPQPEIVKEVSNLWRTGTEFNKNVNLLHDFHNLLSSLLSVTITADNTERFRRKPQHIFDYALSQVYVPPKTKVVEKEIIHTHYKPRRHHLRKTAFLGGYIGGQGNIVGPPASSPPLVYKTVEPTIQKRIDVGAEATAHVDTGAGIQGHGGIGGGQYYKKEVSIQRSPTFFSDIFNIPISALKAVGDFLGNTAANTNISVQKTASVQAESDEKTLKHDPFSSPSSVSSASHVSVETPSASKIIDDIFAIPINTLGAVNKFLENTAAARKNVQVSEDGTVAKRTRIGPHVRRRVNKHIIVVQEPSPTKIE